jgi:hypothetical protein
LQKSAESHERTAKSYDEAAQRRQHGDELLKHAAIHREFAQEDCEMAERLRRMADSGVLHRDR